MYICAVIVRLVGCMVVKACVVETRGKRGEGGNIGSFNDEESLHLYSKEETPNCVNKLYRIVLQYQIGQLTLINQFQTQIMQL
jgi:hypothetical protein